MYSLPLTFEDYWLGVVSKRKKLTSWPPLLATADQSINQSIKLYITRVTRTSAKQEKHQYTCGPQVCDVCLPFVSGQLTSPLFCLRNITVSLKAGCDYQSSAIVVQKSSLDVGIL